MLKKKKAEEGDVIRTEYGMASNTLWLLSRIKKYCPSLIPLMLIGMVTGSVREYFWSFISKFVIDIIQYGKGLGALIKLLAAVAAAEAVIELSDTAADCYIWFKMIYTRFKLIEERVARALSIEYEKLESPKILDCMRRAAEATDNNTEGIEGMMRSLYYDIMTQCAVLAATLTTLSFLDIRLVAAVAVLAVFEYASFVLTVKKDRKNVWDKMAPVWRKIDYMEKTTQDFSCAKDIRIFGMKNWLSRKQRDINETKYRFMKLSKKYWLYNCAFANLLWLIRNALTYSYLIHCVLYKGLSIGDFTLYFGIAASFSNSLSELLKGVGRYKECSMKADDFRTFIELPVQKGGSIPLPDASEGYTFSFENVSFKYAGSERFALKDLSLTLEWGKRLAVVGLNGAGKTTFIKLLLRLYDPTEGRILLNGTDIREFDRGEYYKLFSPVFQNIEIFAFPMSENVSMASPEDTDRKKAENCLRSAGMGEKIDELNDGVQTQLLKVIYDDGIDLSGGQRQKLALARALYKDAPIVVLDEPTAALDALAEYKMYSDFDSITQGKSAVYISHRLSSTRFCDAVAMFENGGLIEYGRHDELIEKGGKYAELFAVQARYYKDGAKEGEGI